MKRMIAAMLALVLVLSLCLSFAPAAHAETQPTDATQPTEDNTGLIQNGKMVLPFWFWIVWGVVINILTIMLLHRVTRNTKQRYAG